MQREAEKEAQTAEREEIRPLYLESNRETERIRETYTGRETERERSREREIYPRSGDHHCRSPPPTTTALQKLREKRVGLRNIWERKREKQRERERHTSFHTAEHLSASGPPPPITSHHRCCSLQKRERSMLHMRMREKEREETERERETYLVSHGRTPQRTTAAGDHHLRSLPLQNRERDRALRSKSKEREGQRRRPDERESSRWSSEESEATERVVAMIERGERGNWVKWGIGQKKALILIFKWRVAFRVHVSGRGEFWSRRLTFKRALNRFNHD